MRKKNRRSGAKKSDDSAGGRWEIVYSWFVLILLCFFIMLSSFSTMEEAKVMQFVKSFVTAVSMMPRGAKFEQGLAVVADSADMVDSKSELAKLFQTLFNLEKEINLVLTREGLVMRMSEHTVFGLGSADIAAAALPLLQKVGAIISKTAYQIRIEGHTDDLPIHTERYPSNWELSTARAVNVLRYFIKNHNVDPRRLAAEGFSEFHQSKTARKTEESKLFSLRKKNRKHPSGRSFENIPAQYKERRKQYGRLADNI
jgi:chemotaxis protein MotB